MVVSVIVFQGVKAVEAVFRAICGYGAGKEVSGRRRRLVVGTCGLLLVVRVAPAGLRDSSAAREVLFRLCLMRSEVTIVWVDSVSAGGLVGWGKRHPSLTVKAVGGLKDASGFVVLPCRWVVERGLVWMMRARRRAMDCERLVRHSETLIAWAAVTLVTRGLARKGATPGRPGEPASADSTGYARPAGGTGVGRLGQVGGSVVDCLVEGGPEVLYGPCRVRGGHSGLGEQDADELMVRVGVGGGAGSAVPAELADGRVVASVGAHRHPEAPAAGLPLTV